jgi:imidazolonepropionase-like amidohydrolase
MRYFFSLLIVLFFSVAQNFAQITYLHCGQLLDVKTGELRKSITIMLHKDSITQVADGYQNPPKEAKLIDLKNRTVLPGLIDCHVHLEFELNRKTYAEKYEIGDADIAFRAMIYAERTLNGGFTTVRDLGGTGVNIALRNAINKGWGKGPRILTAGRIVSATGGHGDSETGAKPGLYDPPTPESGIADGPDECRKAVRAQIKSGADVIKVTATGGVISLARDGRLPHYAADELSSIVQTARDFGVDVAAHAHGDEGIKRAIKAGVISIEHGTFATDSTLDLMKQYGTWLVPTLTAGWAVTDSAKINTGFFPELVRKKALNMGPLLSETLARAHRKGVNIAFGTDSGVCPHGKGNLEFGLMASRSGMPPLAILRSATIDAARMLKWDNRIGSIETGKWADIVAVAGNPLEDIKTMENVVFVMKGGVVYKQEIPK